MCLWIRHASNFERQCKAEIVLLLLQLNSLLLFLLSLLYIIKVMQSTATTPTTITDDSIKTKNVPRSSFTSLFRCLFFAHHPWTYLSIWVSFTFFFISTIPHGKLLRLVSSLLFLPVLVSIFLFFL